MTAPSTPAVAETSPVAAGRPPWALLTTLWVTQYVGIGFLTVGLVAILRADGVSLADLSLVSLLGLAWPLKLLWAPLLDRYGSRRLGHHRSWLLALQSAMVLALLALLAWLRAWIRRLGTEIAVTNYRVIYRRGDVDRWLSERQDAETR